MKSFLSFLAILLIGWGSARAGDLGVRSFTLKNGMRWLVLSNERIPVFSGIVMVRAGGMDETEGKTGLAHMFEHMAFKGSRRLGTKDFEKERPILEEIARLGEAMIAEEARERPDRKKIRGLRERIRALTRRQQKVLEKNEVFEIMTREGAVGFNAFTNKDVTAYVASMPRDKLDVWAHVLSEIVLDPVMREFYQERDVVMEERRLRYENSPFGSLYETLLATAFPGGPYHAPTIGKPRDILNLGLKDAMAFHAKHYIPGNMTGVLVGAVRPADAKRILARTFGRFPGGKEPGGINAPSFAFQGERRGRLSFPAAPTLVLGFYKPRAPARDDFVFDLLDRLLCEGRTARLYERLVVRERLAASVHCTTMTPGTRADNLFTIFAAPFEGRSLEELEGALEEELEKLPRELTVKEIRKVQRQIVSEHYWQLEDSEELAESLAFAETVLGNWRYVKRYPGKMKRISLKETVRTARKYFVKENRVVIYRERGGR